jgi:hypothetical protein
MTESGMTIALVLTGSASAVLDGTTIASEVDAGFGTLESTGGAAVTTAPRAKMLKRSETRTMFGVFLASNRIVREFNKTLEDQECAGKKMLFFWLI